MTVPAMTVSELQARVYLGVEFLDATDPGWWRADLDDGGPEQPRPIDLDMLDMQNPCYCIWGHRLGNYYRLRIPLDKSVALGFDTAAVWADGETYEQWCERRDEEFTALTELWSRVIEQRRAEVSSRA